MHEDTTATAGERGPGGLILGEVVAALEARYDPSLAEDWDAVGLVCGDPEEPVRSVMFAVDPTAEVVDEAITAGVDLLVTHHPLLLTPVHGVPASDPKGRLVHRLVRAGIGLFVAHTNADRAPDHGVNDALAAALGVDDVRPLEAVAVSRTGTLVENSAASSHAGLGRVGQLSRPVTLREFAERVAATLPRTAGGVRIAGDPDRIVRTVAVCGGSGASMLAAATSAGADVFVTSDLKHHTVSEATQIPGPGLCDVAHFASEWPWLPVAADLLHRDLGGRVQVAVSARPTDPWTWQIGGQPLGGSSVGSHRTGTQSDSDAARPHSAEESAD